MGEKGLGGLYCTARQQVQIQIEVQRMRQQCLHSASKKKGHFSLDSIFPPSLSIQT